MTLSYNDLIAQSQQIEIKFIFKSVDETARLKNSPYIRRSAGKLSVGSVRAEVDNSDLHFNSLRTDKANNLGEDGELQLWLNVPPPDNLTFFEGRLVNVEFNENKVFMTFQDRLAITVQKKIGSTEVPVKYYPATWTNQNAADIVWDILTVHGGMDNTASSANVDIDYDAWVEWKQFMTLTLYEIRANFTGQTINNALKLIASLTNSTFYASGEGKIVPKFWIGMSSAAVNSYTADEFDGELESEFDIASVINQYTVFHGYDPVGDTFAGSIVVDDLTSQGDYDIQDIVIESKIVWHNSSVSATDFATKEVDETAAPEEIIEFPTFLHGFGQNPADGIDITYAPLSLANQGLRIEDITLRAQQGTSLISGRTIELFRFLILDDDPQGTLDDVNGLL